MKFLFCASFLWSYNVHRVEVWSIQIDPFFPGSKSNKSIILHSIMHHHMECTCCHNSSKLSIQAWGTAINLKCLLVAWYVWWIYYIGLQTTEFYGNIVGVQRQWESLLLLPMHFKTSRVHRWLILSWINCTMLRFELGWGMTKYRKQINFCS